MHFYYLLEIHGASQKIYLKVNSHEHFSHIEDQDYMFDDLRDELMRSKHYNCPDIEDPIESVQDVHELPKNDSNFIVVEYVGLVNGRH